MKHPTYRIDYGELMDQIDKDMQTRGGARLGFGVTEKNAIFADRVISFLEDRIDREREANKKK